MSRNFETDLTPVSSISEIDALPTDTAAVRVVRLDDHKILRLRRLNALRVLCQDGSSSVTDIGLIHLVALPTLEVLDLHGSIGITDRGLAELRLLDNLRWLDLTGCTRLSEMAVMELRRALPRCEVLR